MFVLVMAVVLILSMAISAIWTNSVLVAFSCRELVNRFFLIACFTYFHTHPNAIAIAIAVPAGST